MTIRKLISQIWVGDRPPPLQWMNTWKDAHPDWEYRLWDQKAIERLPLVNKRLFRKLIKEGSPDGASDVARAEILYNCGGVYIDADSECLKPLDDAPFLRSGFFAVEEKTRARKYLVNGAFMGSVPGHSVLKRYIEAQSQVTELFPTWITVGPVLLTQVIQDGQEKDVEILPPAAFFTKTLAGKRVNGEHYGSHFFSSTSERAGHLPGGKPWPDEDKFAPAISILVPFRDDGHRGRVWEWLGEYWKHALPWAEIVIGTDEGVPFSKAKAANNAAKEATGSVFVLMDADCYMHPGPILRCAERVEKSSQSTWAVPYSTMYRLTKEATEEVMRTNPRRARPKAAAWEERHLRVGRTNASLIMVVPRQAWELVGGMDERFIGWGGEDISFLRALDTLWGKHYTTSNDAQHLWHPRPGMGSRLTRYWDGEENGEATVELEERYRQAAGRPADMRALVDAAH